MRITKTLSKMDRCTCNLVGDKSDAQEKLLLLNIVESNISYSNMSLLKLIMPNHQKQTGVFSGTSCQDWQLCSTCLYLLQWTFGGIGYILSGTDSNKALLFLISALPSHWLCFMIHSESETCKLLWYTEYTPKYLNFYACETQYRPRSNCWLEKTDHKRAWIFK